MIDDSHIPDYLVMEQVGKTLLTLKNEHPQFSLKTIIMVAIKALTALEEIHSCGFLHRDVKPDNIAVSTHASDPRIFLIDLGLSNRYIVNGVHIPYSEKSKFQGTPYFCSRNALVGLRPSRRDDLEALGYVMVFLSVGSLPWFDSSPTRADFVTGIMEIREHTPTSVVCKGLEPEFSEYITYCQSLSFTEKPNYDLLRSKFLHIAQRKQYDLDWKYDWTVPKHVKMTKSSSVRFPKGSSSRREKIKRSGSKPHLFTEDSQRDLGSQLRLSAPVVVTTVSQSTRDNTPNDGTTPRQTVDQLPAFRRPRSTVKSIERTETLVVAFVACFAPARRDCPAASQGERKK